MSYCEPHGKDEVFVGNVFTGSNEKEKETQMGIECRLGSLAFDIHGNELSPEYCLPLFVKKSSLDLYNEIHQEELRKIRAGIK